MEALKNIFTEEDFVYNQFLFLKKTQELIIKDKEDSADLRKAYNAAFASVLLIGYPAARTNSATLNISGEKVALDGYSFSANAEELVDLEPKIAEQLKKVDSQEFSFKTNEEIRLIKEKEAEEERLKAEEKRRQEELEREAQIKEESTELFKEETKSSSKYAYGLEDESGELAETPEFKYLDTMWFYKSHIVCENADRSKGVGKKEFDIILFPIEIPTAEKRLIPMRHIAVIYNDLDERYKYEMPGNSGFGTITYEDYEFIHNLRFDANGEMQVTINVKDKTRYTIVENDDTIIHQSGTCVPKHFGKFLKYGSDTIELFPLYLSNSEKKGIVTCLCIHKDQSGNEYVSIEKDVILCPINDGAENKQITPYWDLENGKKVLKVLS